MAEARPNPRDMRRHQLFATALVVVVTIAIAALGRSQETVRAPLAAKRGGHLYQRMCAVCHGPTGAGYKADQAPAITHPEFLASASDAFLRSAIQMGRPGTTMSAWSVERGSPLLASDIDAVVGFLRGWDRRPHPTLDERPVRGDANRGTEIYVRECARCHGPHGTGGPYVNIGNPQLLTTATNGFLRHAIRNGRPGTGMTGFAAVLGDEGIEDVLALLRSWESSAAMPNQPPAVAATDSARARAAQPEERRARRFQSAPRHDERRRRESTARPRAKMALLDARAPSDYTYEHIAGAVSVPFYDSNRTSRYPQTRGSSATARAPTPNRASSRKRSSTKGSPT